MNEEPKFSISAFNEMKEQLRLANEKIAELKEKAKPENNCVVVAYNDIAALYFNGDHDLVLEDFLREREYPRDAEYAAVWRYFRDFQKACAGFAKLGERGGLDALNALMEGDLNAIPGWTDSYCEHIKNNFEYFRDRDDAWLCINEGSGYVRVCRRGEHSGCIGYPNHREAVLRTDEEIHQGEAQADGNLSGAPST